MMKIGFDAKRAFFNRSGLGNYSRNSILLLKKYYPDHDYFLYTPNGGNPIPFIENDERTHIITPTTIAGRAFPAYWRSYRLAHCLKQDQVELFHGLSNELPHNINHSKTKSIVTIHDIIFIRYPGLYHPIDRYIYKKKFIYSSQIADRVIAVSQQTKSDLVNYFNIEASKIQVVYQGCNPIYAEATSEERSSYVRQKYDLPSHYLLSVGNIEERKNLMSIVRAMRHGNLDIALVVVGKPTAYLKKVQEYIYENKVKYVYFLEGVPSNDLKIIYQLADIFIYPSIFEGFGIPILEALNSRVPVITSKGGCFAEAGGENSIYIDPYNIEEQIHAIKKVLNDSELRKTMIDNGVMWANNFNEDKIAKNLMDVYTDVIKHG
jgi:glycosyltransferase involved in cell wall biosynthesis